MLGTIEMRPEIVVPLAGCAVAVVAIIAGAIVKMHQASVDARLKQRMIDEGWSPDEIQRFLSGGRSPSHPNKPSGEKQIPAKP